MSTLAQLSGTSLFSLLWLIMHSVYCKNKWDVCLGESAGLIYSPSDWQAVEIIFKSRGLSLTRERQVDGVHAHIEEIEA